MKYIPITAMLLSLGGCGMIKSDTTPSEKIAKYQLDAQIDMQKANSALHMKIVDACITNGGTPSLMATNITCQFK